MYALVATTSAPTMTKNYNYMFLPNPTLLGMDVNLIKNLTHTLDVKEHKNN